MKEQSHKDEMSAAIRGDFRRLRDRGVAATLAPRDRDQREPDPVDALQASEPEPESTALRPAVEPEPEPELEAGQAVGEPSPRPTFLARLLGR